VRDSGGLTGTTTRTVDLPSAPPQDMAFIPAGPFTMGSDPGEGYLDEQPEHAPWISAFYMDLREVTNARYAGALNWAMPQGLIEVAAGVTYGTVRQSGSGRPYLYMDGEQDAGNQCRITYGSGVFGVEAGWEDHPVVGVTWYGAAAFCDWRSVIEGLPPAYDPETWDCDHGASGYRLPTEAEWEKAARGEQGERTYPWAGTQIHCDLCNFRSTSGLCTGLTVEVDDPRYAGGASPCGAWHMAGNVWEWCNDWYGADYYAASPAADPTGPAGGTYRVLRGGSWDSYEGYHVRCAYRYSYLPAAWAVVIGFRTARNP
jgi:formylglycine-generating enzyme required for sulfatase activity